MPSFPNIAPLINNWSGPSSSVTGADYKYDYPEGLDLKPGGELHNKLIGWLLERANNSKAVLSTRKNSWRDIDRNLRVFMRPSRNNESVGAVLTGRVDQKASNSTTERELILPYSYATMEALLTYLSVAFFQEPMFPYTGVGPDDVMGAQLLELVVQQQVERNNVGLALHTQIRDSLAYGIGVTHPYWKRVRGKLKPPAAPVMDLQGAMEARQAMLNGGTTGTLYEGNALENIDPYNYFPDPNVAAQDIQKAEYVGWLSKTNYIGLLRREGDDSDFVFNCRYVEHTDGRSALRDNTDQRSEVRPGENSRVGGTSPVDVLWMYVDLIPAMWGLGNSEKPEKWLFGVAADQVIIAAQPLGLNHDMFPVTVAAPDFDGYSAFPFGRLEVIQDIQEIIDLLYNSRILNIRKSLNDMWVVDPSVVNVYDLLDPKPGKIIRTRRAMWGRGGIGDSIKQFPVSDVTAGNINDTMFLQDLMANTAGATDALKGVVSNRGPRISAEAASNAAQSGINRIERLAIILRMQMMNPMALMFASHTQQLMETETWVRLTQATADSLLAEFGDQISVERNRIKATRDAMDVYTDLDYSGNIMPGSQNASNWTQLFQILASTPQLGLPQQFNMTGIFKHIAKIMGAKNIDDFIIRAGAPAVMPDQQVQDEVNAGNLVPVPTQEQIPGYGA